ncbi:GTPase domain-containing protein [Micromonospora saelicesensis]|uniref:GTPase domain-containing protein n=1 Tax=Micromonospora saelicesensis TaxID=285676 RepID=UPI000DD75997|nr:GTPase domain-containing protein [Micromonospora saelicesensis]
MSGMDRSLTILPAAFRALIVADGRDVSRALARAAQEIDAQIIGSEHRWSLGDAVDYLHHSAVRLEAVCESLADRDVERPLRVVLMGQTMAGKSTLFEYLSGGDGARVGDGRQRFSRDACIRVATEIGVEIVDTPGVGAMDGKEDYEFAFRQVADADLILWVATTRATQEQTGQALERLADLGKPILVALNCLKDVTDEIGLLDMLEEPELVFGGDAMGNLAPIRRYLSRAGGRYIDAVAIHAQAARLALSGALDTDEARTLHANSRIDSLVSALRLHADGTFAQRRIVSICDSLRLALLDTADAVEAAHATASSALTAGLGMQLEFRKRGSRRVDDAYEELQAAFSAAITARERWAESVDVDRDLDELNERLNNEMAALRTDFERSIADVGQRLQADLEGVAVDVADDWTGFGGGGFRELGGRGTVWGNRAVKVGGRFAVGMGGLMAGAFIGSFLGPGLGTAIGAVSAGVIGLVSSLLGLDRLIDWIGDRSFRSAAEVRERRRRKVRDQMSELLLEFRKSLVPVGERVRQDWLDAVEGEAARQYAASAVLERSIAVLRRLASEEIEPVNVRIDTELVRELLRCTGRERAASTVIRATRWRGAGMAIEVPEPVFDELVHAPAAECVERIVPTSAQSSAAASALQIIRHLADREVTVHEMGPDSLEIALDAPVAPGAQEAWHALARVHTGVDVRIRDVVKGGLS